MREFNTNLLNFNKNSETMLRSFVDFMHANFCVSLIKRITKVTINSTTWIDNIFISSYANTGDTLQCLIYKDLSNHFSIVHIDSE